MNSSNRPLRHKMVSEQLVRRGIRDPRVLAAFQRVPRHLFVPAAQRGAAYADQPLPIGYGQTISQPYIVAQMLEALELRGGERVLDVGTGSGYQAALLGCLAREVYSLEIIPEFVEPARALLAELGYRNVRVLHGDGSLGWGPAAPYDAIVVGAASPMVPSALAEQLGHEGRLVLPVGDRSGQRLVVVKREADRTPIRDLGGCVFVPLIGHYDVEPAWAY